MFNKSEALQIISDRVSGCTNCPGLSEYRQKNKYKTVAGEGDPDASILVVGEAPGENEALSGRPFVGNSGKLLDSLLGFVGSGREKVFIANTVKCRPPENRDPTRKEVCNCLPLLELQIKIIQPEYILCLGRVAALNLLKPSGVDEEYWFSKTLASMRGKLHNYKGIKTLCTYHPSYLLRNQFMEKEFISDLKLIGLRRKD
jgi:uracil-DNA glycosylase family 4